MAFEQYVCKHENDYCPDDQYCDTVMSRCQRCEWLCNLGRDMSQECCTHCPDRAKGLNLECPPPTVSAARPPQLSTRKPSPTKKPRRPHFRSPKRRRKEPRTKSQPRQPKIKYTTTPRSQTVKSSQFTHPPRTTVLPAISSLSTLAGGHGATSKVQATGTVLAQIAEPGSGYDTVLLYCLLVGILAVVCLIGVCLLVLLFYKNRKKNQDGPSQTLDKEKEPEANLQGNYLLAAPDVCMTPLSVDDYDFRGNMPTHASPLPEYGHDLRTIKVHGGERGVGQYGAADIMEGCGGFDRGEKESERMLAHCQPTSG